jgi:hypothetical protein
LIRTVTPGNANHYFSCLPLIFLRNIESAKKEWMINSRTNLQKIFIDGLGFDSFQTKTFPIAGIDLQSLLKFAGVTAMNGNVNFEMYRI